LNDHEINLNFVTEGETDGLEISGEKRRHIFLVVKEALHNVVKHANATEVAIDIRAAELLMIKIKDNGKGFEGSENTFGNGLKNMHNRVNKINGNMLIQNSSGTEISIEIPI